MASEIEAPKQPYDLEIEGWHLTRRALSFRVVCWSADAPGTWQKFASVGCVDVVKIDIRTGGSEALAEHYHTSVYLTKTQVLVPREYTNKRKRTCGFDDFVVRATLFVNGLNGSLWNKACVLVFVLVYAEMRVKLHENKVDVSNSGEAWYPQHQEYLSNLERVLDSIPKTVRDIAAKLYEDTSTLRPGSRYT